MTPLSPIEAAEQLRPLLADSPWPVPPEPHMAHYLAEICRTLNAPANALNIVHVRALMQRAGLEPIRPWEYPRALNILDPAGSGRMVQAVWPKGHVKAGEPVVFHDADEERAYYAEHGG
jgi:hypothetical protein